MYIPSAESEGKPLRLEHAPPKAKSGGLLSSVMHHPYGWLAHYLACRHAEAARGECKLWWVWRRSAAGRHARHAHRLSPQPLSFAMQMADCFSQQAIWQPQQHTPHHPVASPAQQHTPHHPVASPAHALAATVVVLGRQAHHFFLSRTTAGRVTGLRGARGTQHCGTAALNTLHAPRLPPEARSQIAVCKFNVNVRLREEQNSSSVG